MRRPPASSGHMLDVVPEDSSASPSPLSYRPSHGRSDSNIPSLRQSRGKGKARDMSGMQRSASEDAISSMRRQEGEASKKRKAGWYVDVQEVTKNLDKWNQRERVILVIGSESGLSRLV